MSLRKHQRETLAISQLPEFGTKIRRIVASVTPGGGKSSLPIIVGDSLLKRRLADKICWVVPRSNLREQAELSFIDNRFRSILGHTMQIRASSNDVDPSRGSQGYSTTYQAISSDPMVHINEFRKHRYVLAMDELHHVAEDSLWHQCLKEMAERAEFLLLMSGTLSRDDDARIAFIDYDLTPDFEWEPFLEDTDDTRVVRYTRTDGLAEKAVLPIMFERIDASAKWRDGNGVEREVSSLANISKVNGAAALFTILRQDYTKHLLGAMLTHWREALQTNPRSKFLVVAPNIAMAKDYLKTVRELGVTSVDIATSDDGEEAKINIDRLRGRGKKPPVSGLVTVGMAYEGLDCPEINHIACLTNIRSFEWLEQMLARATRVDYAAGPYETQFAHVWAPDDDAFTDAVQSIQSEQVKAASKKEKDEKPFKVPTLQELESKGITPLEALATSRRAIDMQTGMILVGGDMSTITGSAPVVERTISEKENELRQQLDKRIKRLAAGKPDLIKRINGTLIKRFRKPRAQMDVRALEDAIDLVEEIARSS